MGVLMPLVQRKRLQPARIVTHTMPLKDAPRGYSIFDQKQDRAIKVMLTMRDYVRRHSAGSLIRSSFQISVRYFRELFAAALVASIPATLWDLYTWTFQPSIVGVTLSVVFGFLNMVPMTVLVSDVCVGNRPHLGRAYRRAFGPVTPRMLLSVSLSLLVMAAGLLLLVIPGIVFGMWYWFVGVVNALESTTVRGALKRSRELGRGFYLRNMAVFMLVFIVAMTPLLLMGGMFGAVQAMTNNPTVLMVMHVVGVLAGVAVTLPIYVATILLYYDMRVRKEAYDSTTLAEDLKR
jgi:hypothetical protein